MSLKGGVPQRDIVLDVGGKKVFLLLDSGEKEELTGLERIIWIRYDGKEKCAFSFEGFFWETVFGKVEKEERDGFILLKANKEGQRKLLEGKLYAVKQKIWSLSNEGEEYHRLVKEFNRVWELLHSDLGKENS